MLKSRNFLIQPVDLIGECTTLIPCFEPQAGPHKFRNRIDKMISFEKKIK